MKQKRDNFFEVKLWGDGNYETRSYHVAIHVVKVWRGLKDKSGKDYIMIDMMAEDRETALGQAMRILLSELNAAVKKGEDADTK